MKALTNTTRSQLHLDSWPVWDKRRDITSLDVFEGGNVEKTEISLHCAQWGLINNKGISSHKNRRRRFHLGCDVYSNEGVFSFISSSHSFQLLPFIIIFCSCWNICLLIGPRMTKSSSKFLWSLPSKIQISASNGTSLPRPAVKEKLEGNCSWWGLPRNKVELHIQWGALPQKVVHLGLHRCQIGLTNKTFVCII